MEERKVKRMCWDDRDLEPVSYCSECYSLKIGSIDGVSNSDYCMECGCTETRKATIEEWERLYEKRYGSKFVERKQNPLRARIYRMSWEELKEELFCGGHLNDIMRAMYPRLSSNMPRADKALLFLDKVMRDGRTDELRNWIYLSNKNNQQQH